jgi:hypothetical protein
VPAATAFPSAVWNAGQEIRAVPAATVPSARYTVSLIVVSAGPWAQTAGTAIAAKIKPNSARYSQ